MLTTDFSSLFKQVTSGVSEYVMFLVFLFVIYLFIAVLIKLVTDSIISIIIAIRSPITTSLEDHNEE